MAEVSRRPSSARGRHPLDGAGAQVPAYRTTRPPAWRPDARCRAAAGVQVAEANVARGLVAGRPQGRWPRRDRGWPRGALRGRGRCGGIHAPHVSRADATVTRSAHPRIARVRRREARIRVTHGATFATHLGGRSARNLCTWVDEVPVFRVVWRRATGGTRVALMVGMTSNDAPAFNTSTRPTPDCARRSVARRPRRRVAAPLRALHGDRHRRGDPDPRRVALHPRGPPRARRAYPPSRPLTPTLHLCDHGFTLSTSSPRACYQCRRPTTPA